MAFTAAANATQRVGNYAPGSLAAQPRRFAGGVRKRGESPEQMANRMDAGYMASAMQGGTSAPTRADNIAKARADGTFDAKRNAFNAANQGSFMDAAGNIGPKAEMPTSPASAPPSPAPPSAPAPNTTATAPAKPKGPATFDGKSKADFFGAAMNKYGPTAGVSAYKEQGVMAVAANGGKPLPTPSPAAPAAAKPSGTVAAASSPAKPYAGPMARPAGSMASKPPAPPMAIARPAAKPSMAQAASPKAPATQVASMPAANHSSPKPPAQPSIDELRQKAEAAEAARQPGLTKVAKIFVGAAQAVDKGVPAAVASVTSGIKNTGDSIVSAIDRGMAPARRWLYGSNQETPEEKAYKDAMAKQPQAQPDKQQPEPPKKKSPTFRKPYLANRPASLN